MSQVIKAFMGVFMVMFLMVTSTGVLGAFYQVLHAQNTHAAMIDEIENSNFARPVMESCFAMAKEKGYALQLSLYSENHTVITCMNQSELPENTEDVILAEVALKYSIEVAFFEVDAEQELFGYAR